MKDSSLSNQIYKELRNRICLRVYPQGAILKEEEIAEEFSVSRTPIREAFQHLRLDGLVESKKRLGTVVTGFDETTLRELYEIRINLMDFVAIESNKQYSRTSIEKMRGLLQRAMQLSESNNSTEYWMINDELFEILISVICNHPLRQNVESLFLQTARNWAVLLPQNWQRACDILKREIETELEFMEMADRRGVFVARKCFMMLSFRFCHGA